MALWNVYIVERPGGVRNMTGLGRVRARHVGEAHRRAQTKWPGRENSNGTLPAFHFRLYRDDPFSLGRNQNQIRRATP